MVFYASNVHGINGMKNKFLAYDVFVVVLLLYLFVGQLYAIWPFTIDDMYIPLRYAKHWVMGEGIVWNPSEAPVEGYSNFSFMVLAAAALSFKGNPVFVLKAAGALGLLLTCLFVYLISRFWFNKRVSLLPCIALLLYKGQIIWAMSGLETTVYEALLCASVYFLFRSLGHQEYPKPRREPQTHDAIFAALCCVLASLTRPEAPVLVGCFFGLLCWGKSQDGLRRNALYFIGVFLLLYTPYFLWRWSYFGYLFPNPVYCKGIATEHFFKVDLQYLKLIFVVGPFALIASMNAKDTRHLFLWAPSIIYLLLLWSADPVVAFDNRLFLPAFALLLPLFVVGLQQGIGALKSKGDSFFYLWLYLCCLFCIPWMTFGDYQYFSQNPQRGEQLRQEVIHWLNVFPQKSDVVVLGDSGLIPYASPLHFIDSYCLNNKLMAHYPVANRYEKFCQHALDAHPSVIVLTSLIKDGQQIYTPSDACLKPILEQHKEYRLSTVFSAQATDSIYRYELFSNL